MAYDSTIYNSIIDTVANILEEVKVEIQRQMQSKNINASGRTSAGFAVQRYEAGVRLVLGGDKVALLATLEVGRRGVMQDASLKVPKGFTDIIEQWSIDKGLQFPTDGDRRSFAYLTARKIYRQGTHRREQSVDVYSEAVNRGVEQVRKLVAAEVTKYIHTSLNDIIPH